MVENLSTSLLYRGGCFRCSLPCTLHLSSAVCKRLWTQHIRNMHPQFQPANLFNGLQIHLVYLIPPILLVIFLSSVTLISAYLYVLFSNSQSLSFIFNTQQITSVSYLGIPEGRKVGNLLPFWSAKVHTSTDPCKNVLTSFP